MERDGERKERERQKENDLEGTEKIEKETEK